MARSARIYVPLDAAFFEQDEVEDAGERATYLYVAILCRVKQLESDGWITSRQIAKLNISGWQKRTSDLVRVGLLLTERASDRYLIPGWSKWNELKHEREERLEKDRERKRKQAESSGNPDGIQADSVHKQVKHGKKAVTGTPQPPPVDDVLRSLRGSA